MTCFLRLLSAAGRRPLARFLEEQGPANKRIPCIYTCVYIYICTIESERERERERERVRGREGEIESARERERGGEREREMAAKQKLSNQPLQTRFSKNR